MSVKVRRIAVYETSDGQSFKDLSEAERHESSLVLAVLQDPENREVFRLSAYLSEDEEDRDGSTTSDRELFQDLLEEALLARKYNPTSA